MSVTPRDYQERNWLYDVIAKAVSYPLQGLSILAGAYLLFEVGSKLFALPAYSTMSILLMCTSLVVFLLIETVRRSLVFEVGYHYLATYTYETTGEWLRTKLIVLACISALLVASGTYGAYQYSQNNAPQTDKIDLKQVTTPLLTSIQNEKNQIAQIDKTVATLQGNKSAELKDDKSYALWAGKLYLLPETKTRHAGYDAQIGKLQNQREAHLKMLSSYESKLDKTEDKTHTQNAQILTENLLQKNAYSLVCALIWLFFEALLLYCIAYEWLYRVGAKNYIFDQQDLQDNQDTPSYLPAPLLQQPKPPLQQPLQQSLNQDLQDLFSSLARENQEKQARLARRKQEKQDAPAPNFQGLVNALQQGETKANVLQADYNVNLQHVNSAKALLGIYIKEPDKVLNTSEYASIARFLGIPIHKKTSTNADLFSTKGGASWMN